MMYSIESIQQQQQQRENKSCCRIFFSHLFFCCVNQKNKYTFCRYRMIISRVFIIIIIFSFEIV